MTEFKIIPTNDDINKRIDVFLSQNLPDFSRSFIQNLLKKENILINNLPIKKNYKLINTSEITVIIENPLETEIKAEEIPLNIIYEDDDIIVINKPKGMVVHPAAGNYSGTLVNALLYHCKDSLSGINGEIRPGIVHRIDKDTTGLLVVCKNDIAHVDVANQIKEHSAHRIYEGIVIGTIKDDIGTVNRPIGRHKTDRKKMCVTNFNSKEAITHYEVIARYNGYTHLKFKLETGRTHQIRVHMQSIGHALLGDEVYGSSQSKFKTNGQCLHARTLILKHPKTNEIMEFSADLPDYFKEILTKLSKVGN